MERADLSDDQILSLLKDAEHRLNSAVLTERNITSLSTAQISLSTDAKRHFSQPYIKSVQNGAQVDPSLLVTATERKLANSARLVQEPALVKGSIAKSQKDTAGADWYNLPRTALTPELKRDFQLLRLRSVLDPHRHYKKDNSRINNVPEFSQVGTIIEGPTEYFSSRLTNKERSRTFVEEVLAGENATKRFKSKYNEIQAKRTSGKKAHYKIVKAQRARKYVQG